MSAASTSASPRYEFLDALRGLAILGVISTHCAFFVGGDFRGKPFAFAGLYGVQLFFMVSAFTIFMTLERARARDQAIVRNFFIRRILRILPMFWVGIILYSFVPGREHAAPDLQVGFLHYALTAILQNGWHPNYINCLVPGGWTISVEATFYMIAPFLFFKIGNWQRALVFFLMTLLVCTFANNALRIATNHHLIFQSVEPEMLRQFSRRWFPSQLPVFGFGILIYYILHDLPETFRTKRNGLVLLVTAMVSLYTVVDIGSHRLIPEQVFFAFGFGLLILSLAIYPFPLLVNSAVGFLGRISYSFYLLHFVVMAGAIYGLNACIPSVFNKPALAYVSLFMVVLAIATPLCWVTYKLIEQPFIRLSSNLIRRLG